MITCKELNRLLTDYVDKKVPLSKRILIKIHLIRCKNCRRVYKQFKKMLKMTGKINLMEVNSDAIEMLMPLFKSKIA